MSKGVTVADLKDQVGKPGPHPNLVCECCGSEYSANAGDYFMVAHDKIFECCDEPLVLTIKRTTYERV